LLSGYADYTDTDYTDTDYAAIPHLLALGLYFAPTAPVVAGAR
jgi:hypothetical protein